MFFYDRGINRRGGEKPSKQKIKRRISYKTPPCKFICLQQTTDCGLIMYRENLVRHEPQTGSKEIVIKLVHVGQVLQKSCRTEAGTQKKTQTPCAKNAAKCTHTCNTLTLIRDGSCYQVIALCFLQNELNPLFH